MIKDNTIRVQKIFLTLETGNVFCKALYNLHLCQKKYLGPPSFASLHTKSISPSPDILGIFLVFSVVFRERKRKRPADAAATTGAGGVV